MNGWPRKPIPWWAQSAIDRFTSNAHNLVIDSESSACLKAGLPESQEWAKMTEFEDATGLRTLLGSFLELPDATFVVKKSHEGKTRKK